MGNKTAKQTAKQTAKSEISNQIMTLIYKTVAKFTGELICTNAQLLPALYQDLTCRAIKLAN